MSDLAIQQKTDFMRSLFTAPPTYLRLFQNNFSPAPANTISDFVEATYAGYVQREISGVIGAKSQIIAGEWHFFSPVETYPAPSSGASQTIYGWYIVASVVAFGVYVVCSARFDSPVVMSVGGLPFSLQIEWMDCAGSIVPWP